MSDDRTLLKKYAPIAGVAGIIVALSLWFFAPCFHGHSDEAAWVQMWMIPTLVLCVLFGGLFIFFRNRIVAILLLLTSVAHLCVALGFHPR